MPYIIHLNIITLFDKLTKLAKLTLALVWAGLEVEAVTGLYGLYKRCIVVTCASLPLVWLHLFFPITGVVFIGWCIMHYRPQVMNWRLIKLQTCSRCQWCPTVWLTLSWWPHPVSLSCVYVYVCMYHVYSALAVIICSIFQLFSKRTWWYYIYKEMRSQGVLLWFFGFFSYYRGHNLFIYYSFNKYFALYGNLTFLDCDNE